MIIAYRYIYIFLVVKIKESYYCIYIYIYICTNQWSMKINKKIKKKITKIQVHTHTNIKKEKSILLQSFYILIYFTHSY